MSYQASIVIPVFNRAHLVRRAIDTAIAQTLPCEVILVDHGSTDDIGDVAASYGERIRYIRREQDNGPVAGWIDGIQHSTGEYVHITYDDDWLQPEFMARCIAAMDADVGFAYTRVTLHGENSTSTILHHPAGQHPVEGLVRYMLRSALTISPGCAVFRRRDAIDNLLPEVPHASGPYGPKKGVGEDLLLFLLTSLRYPRYAHIPEPLADFLAHEGSITASAQSQGRALALAAAYSNAKAHYCRQPNAIAPATGIRQFVDRLAWRARSALSG